MKKVSGWLHVRPVAKSPDRFRSCGSFVPVAKNIISEEITEHNRKPSIAVDSFFFSAVNLLMSTAEAQSSEVIKN